MRLGRNLKRMEWENSTRETEKQDKKTVSPFRRIGSRTVSRKCLDPRNTGEQLLRR